MVAAAGCVAALVFNTLGSLAARRLGFRYALLAPGSLVLYAATGYLAARTAEGILVGAAAGAAVAAVESTFGWRISRGLGVDTAGDIDEASEMLTTTLVTLSGALLGGLAALLA